MLYRSRGWWPSDTSTGTFTYYFLGKRPSSPRSESWAISRRFAVAAILTSTRLFTPPSRLLQPLWPGMLTYAIDWKMRDFGPDAGARWAVSLLTSRDEKDSFRLSSLINLPSLMIVSINAAIARQHSLIRSPHFIVCHSHLLRMFVSLMLVQQLKCRKPIFGTRAF